MFSERRIQKHQSDRVVVFRVDASTMSGTGHVMRCLCLADALKAKGCRTIFVYRFMLPHLQNMLATRQHEFVQMPQIMETWTQASTPYLSWLGTSEHQDALDTAGCLQGISVDWLIVDHYALGADWESQLRPMVGRILAIDDLADRKHDCDLLLDQNCSTELQNHYQDLTPRGTKLLLGPQFALLREEFSRLRTRMTPRAGKVHKVLVLYGGVDVMNLTGLTVDALIDAAIPNLNVDVVVGLQHPALSQIKLACDRFGYVLHEQSNQIARLMTDADFSFGAGGSTSWERCCLGLPSALVKVADNQAANMKALRDLGICFDLGEAENLNAAKIRDCLIKVVNAQEDIRKMSERALALVDGHGVDRVLKQMNI